ncbi:hypothetical protein Tco_1522544 [Tanacetum coccineum]
MDYVKKSIEKERSIKWSMKQLSLIANRTESQEQDTKRQSGNMHMLIDADIQDPSLMKSQWLRYIVQSYRGRTQSLVAEKTDISENRASRNFDLMIIKWRLLKITLQAPFLNVHKTFDVHDRSGLPMS